MRSTSIWRRGMAVATIALAAATVTQPAAVAEQRAVDCPTGYLCLQTTKSPSTRLVLVREGERREFPDGLRVGAVSNQTSLGYCVHSRPYNYSLAPEREAVRDHVVLAVAPSSFCYT